MKCFVHQSSDAVGLCRNCSRGVCAVCANDLSSGIACRGRCEEAVEATAALIGRNVAMAGKSVSIGHWMQLVFFALMGPGAIIGAIGILNIPGEDNRVLAAVLFIGGLMLVGLAVNYVRWIRASALKPKVTT